MNTILTNNLPLESKIQLLCGLGLPVDGVRKLIKNKTLTLKEAIENSLVQLLAETITQINLKLEPCMKSSCKYNLTLTLDWFDEITE